MNNQAWAKVKNQVGGPKRRTKRKPSSEPRLNQAYQVVNQSGEPSVNHGEEPNKEKNQT